MTTTYMVLAEIKGKFCNGMSNRGDLYTINPTVGTPINANSPEEAVKIYKSKSWRKGDMNVRAIEYNLFMQGKVAQKDDDCPF
jgi:hypothetical protein